MRAALVCVVVVPGCEPPPAPGGGTGGLSIEILYPSPGDIVLLDEACVLRSLLIVHITGLELVPPDPANPVEGQGHWHGGPDLANGYCLSSEAFCVGSDGSVPGTYDGSTVSPGNATLFAGLRDNAHGLLEGATDAQVEIEVVDPSGTCP